MTTAWQSAQVVAVRQPSFPNSQVAGRKPLVAQHLVACLQLFSSILTSEGLAPKPLPLGRGLG